MFRSMVEFINIRNLASFGLPRLGETMPVNPKPPSQTPFQAPYERPRDHQPNPFLWRARKVVSGEPQSATDGIGRTAVRLRRPVTVR